MLALGVLAIALTSSGCGGQDSESVQPVGPTGLEVIVTPDRVEAGGEIEARIRNGTASDYTYGAAYLLERQAEAGFEPVPLPRTPVPQIGLVAEPGEEGPPVPIEIPADLEPGTYRVTLGPDADPAIFLVG